MAYSDILFEVRNQIAWLTINRPDQGNTFRRQTVLEMIQALNEARNDAGVRVVVITGAGDRFFCIGGEKEPNEGAQRRAAPLPQRAAGPLIAMVNGFSVGGGNVLANMCDLTVASEQATFRQVGPAMGSYDAGFGTWYPEDSVGRKRAREIWYLNRKYSAKDAQAMGPVNEVAPHALLRERTEAMCEELKKRGPQALGALKAAFHARHNGVTGLSRVTIDHLVANYYHTEEAKEMGRAFNSKQDPDPDKFYK
jgi:naphthoate synthase